jgi:hypothetical protein
MHNIDTEKIIRERGLVNPMTLWDIDGPGTGNSAVVERLERPEKGILVHLVGYKYPYQGIPIKDSVMALATVKKTIFSSLHILRGKCFMALVGLLMILPKFIRNGFITPLLDHYEYLMDYYLRKELLKPHRYSRCVRELYRVFDEMIEGKKGIIKRVLILARDFVCMSVDYDSAYRFRFQDIFGEIRVSEMTNRKIVREVNRLFDLFIERERGNGMKLKWDKVRKMVIPLLRISPQLRKTIIDFVKRLDLNEIKLGSDDWYFCTLRMDYKFRGVEYEKRVEERKEIEGENWKYFENIAREFLKEYKRVDIEEKRQRLDNPKIYKGLK